ncbi:hypothetical protein diail_1877 [Diaporthe ilicicola]|nr:hypothetical protein diail_1877 [Diaporthe ilicicola]
MSIVPRGWSTYASTALKLATAERIIGYQFKKVDLLYEALDQEKAKLVSSSGEQKGLRTRNTRQALVGDALARLDLAERWYEMPDMMGSAWQEISAHALSNDHLGQVGHKLGLDECAIPSKVESRYNMASLVEAIFAAVHMDGASKSQLQKVMHRLGVGHKLLDPIHRTWIHNAVISQLNLPDRFFIGHQFRLQEAVFETSLKRTPLPESPPPHLIGLAQGLWERFKRPWLWLIKQTTREVARGRKTRRLGFNKSATSPGTQRSVAGKARAPAKKPSTTPSEKIDGIGPPILDKNSLDYVEEDKREAASQQMMDKHGELETKKDSEESTSDGPMAGSSKSKAPVPTNRESQLDSSKKGASVGAVELTAADTQGSKKTSKESGPGGSIKENPTDSVELKDKKQPNKDSSAEAVKKGRQALIQKAPLLKKKLKLLQLEESKMLKEFQELRKAGKSETPENLEIYEKLQERRARIQDNYDGIMRKLNQKT